MTEPEEDEGRPQIGKYFLVVSEDWLDRDHDGVEGWDDLDKAKRSAEEQASWEVEGSYVILTLTARVTSSRPKVAWEPEPGE